MYKIFFILLLLSNLLFSMTAITVTYPIEQFFLKKIVGNELYITTISLDKNTLDLKEDNIKKFSNNYYYFNFNLDEEKQISKILKSNNSRLKTFNMLKDIPFMKASDGKINPYIWTDPILCRDIAKNIYTKMVEIRPADKVIFKINYESFLKELDKTYLDIKARFDRSDLYGIFTFNHELDYFTKRFRINNYHKKYQFLNINEAKNLIEFVDKEHIKHIVIPKNSDYKVPEAYKGYINGKIVEYDIYSVNWKVNLYTILRGIENF